MRPWEYPTSGRKKEGRLENPYKAQSKVNPQRANRATAPGHHDRRVNSDVWHALMLAGMSGGEYQVVLTVIDRTWGFSLLSAPIPLKKFEDSTNLTRQGIIKALKRVEGRQIIVCHRNGTQTTEYLFNKHYDTWIMPPSKRELTSEGGESPDGEETRLVNGGSPAPSEPVFTSKENSLVNQRSPDKSTSVHQSSEPQLPSASKLTERGTEPVKTLIIDTPIDNTIDSNNLSAEISKLYSENIGFIKPALADDMREFCESFRGPVAWVKPAFREALSRNKKNWQYIRAILENWEEKGGPDDGGRKSTSTTHRPGTRGHTAKELRDSLRRSKPA